MTQADLFELERFTRRGDSIVPPSAEEIAKRRRDDGIARAAAHADDVDPRWQTRAFRAVAIFARYHPAFLAEDARGMAEREGLPSPPDARAWGAVMRLAARRGVIVADGYGPANSSNRSPKVKWRSLVYR